MLKTILFDTPLIHYNLLPITYTRPICLIRVGIRTIAEKWQDALGGDTELSHLTIPYLQEKFPCNVEDDEEALFIAGHIFPTPELTAAIQALEPGQDISHEGNVVAMRGTMQQLESHDFSSTIQLKTEPKQLHFLYDIFLQNGEQAICDYARVTAGRASQPLSGTNTVIGPRHDSDGRPLIFIEEGSYVEGVTLNTNDGPVYIGQQCEIMEGSCIRGPFAACAHAHVNMGSKIYGPTTLGPYCKVGGELNNVVMIGYSNKGHDGFLGNAVIGEWCNIGAGTSASNLKNDYTEIKLWNYPAERFLRTGLQFCGLMMGDHSKAGVNCMFNTATVLGVGVNIHGSGFPRVFTPSFSEGSAAGVIDVPLTKFFQIAERMMARRDVKLTDADRRIFTHIYNQADNYK